LPGGRNRWTRGQRNVEGCLIRPEFDTLPIPKRVVSSDVHCPTSAFAIGVLLGTGVGIAFDAEADPAVRGPGPNAAPKARHAQSSSVVSTDSPAVAHEKKAQNYGSFAAVALGLILTTSVHIT
jgi:hypothetical protein